MTDEPLSDYMLERIRANAPKVHADALKTNSAWLMTATGDYIPALLAEVDRLRKIADPLARGFVLYYASHRNAYVCALCDAELAADDFGMDSKRDAPGWYETHITHTPECLVTLARAGAPADEPA